ncbi:MAG: tRNA (adenosine(37)-N6)-dimethylallyltransferase MiaA [Armatimonadetes bacterium]|nr:tRNA (adenosine(37)-N6)-dimethylallyltransferase MiaA [Armatimonadota bacterium]
MPDQQPVRNAPDDLAAPEAEGATGASPIPLLVITGPTAAGKTSLAVEVARQVPAEIISADSMAVYRGMDIGTAKPTPAQRRAVRFHLLDLVEPDEPYTVADWLRDAEAAIEDITGRGRLPILCGGTGLYLRALLHGYSLPPTDFSALQAVRGQLEARLRAEGLAALTAELLSRDPKAAELVDLANPRRVLRALETVLLLGRPLAEVRRADPDAAARWKAEVYVVTCPRPVLYRRIDRRVDEMLAAGWLEETRRLHPRLARATTALQAIGYRRLLAHLAGEITLDEARELIKRDTRHYAKRQLTWWRREQTARWLPWANGPDFVAALLVLVRAARRLLPHT